jgi:cell division ATPase FtsA
MIQEQPTLIIDIGTGSIKMMVGTEISSRPVILHFVQSEYRQIISQEKLVDPTKTAQLIKKMLRDIDVHFGEKMRNIQVVIPPMNLEVFHGEKRTNVIDPNGVIHPMDIHNVYQMFFKESAGTNVTQASLVPVSYQINGGIISVNPPIGEITNNIVLQAFVQFVQTAFFNEVVNMFKLIEVPVRRYILDGQGIADMIETQHKDFPMAYVLIDHGANQTYLHLISQHKLIRSVLIESGGEQLTALIANRFNLPEAEARQIKEKFGYDTRASIYDGWIVNQPDLKIKQSQLNAVIKEYYDHLLDDMNLLLKEYQVDGNKMDLTDMKFVLVGGGGNLIGMQELLSGLGQGQGVEKPWIKTVGARNIQVLSSIGGLRFAHRYKIVDDDRQNIRLTRQTPHPNRRQFNDYDE